MMAMTTRSSTRVKARREWSVVTGIAIVSDGDEVQILRIGINNNKSDFNSLGFIVN